MADFFKFCPSHPEHRTHVLKRHIGNREMIPVTLQFLSS